MKTFKEFILENWADYKKRPNDKRTGEMRIGQYDTDFYDKKPTTGYYRDPKTDKPFAYKHELTPKVPIVSRVEDILKPDDNVIHRGISHDEYHDILKTGRIKSKGAGNMGGQENLTYYSTDPGAAGAYASYFAMNKYSPTPDKPAYVISVKKPHPSRIKHIEGTGEHEIGVEGDISADDIVSVHRGNVIQYDPPYRDRNLDSNATYGLKNKKQWKKVKNTLGGIKSGSMSSLNWEKIK